LLAGRKRRVQHPKWLHPASHAAAALAALSNNPAGYNFYPLSLQTGEHRHWKQGKLLDYKSHIRSFTATSSPD
jgi:hypothetical protein